MQKENRHLFARKYDYLVKTRKYTKKTIAGMGYYDHEDAEEG